MTLKYPKNNYASFEFINFILMIKITAFNDDKNFLNLFLTCTLAGSQQSLEVWKYLTKVGNKTFILFKVNFLTLIFKTETDKVLNFIKLFHFF